MRTFFLFYILNSFLGNPLLALLVLGLVFWISEAQWSGRYFNPSSWFQRRGELHKLRTRVETNPHDVAAHNDLGRLLLLKGKVADSIQHLRKAVVRMDDSAETQYWLGRALLADGKTDEAIEHLKTALKLEPRHNYGQPWVVLARGLLDRDRAQEAVGAAQQAVAINTSTVEGWLLLGQAQLAIEDRQGAKHSFAAAEKAYDGLPRYLRLESRGFARQARKLSRGL